MRAIAIDHAKRRPSALITAAEHGEEIVITRRGRSVRIS